MFRRGAHGVGQRLAGHAAQRRLPRLAGGGEAIHRLALRGGSNGGHERQRDSLLPAADEACMKKDPVISISAGALHLDIAPGIGGSIARFYGKEKHQTIEWIRPASAEALAEGNPRLMASFPLAP